jgi:hypothetical protein
MTDPTAPEARLTKPSQGHNRLYGPVLCLCRNCARKVLALRCPVILEGNQRCGLYRHRGRTHALIPATIWAIAEERSHDPI